MSRGNALYAHICIGPPPPPPHPLPSAFAQPILKDVPFNVVFLPFPCEAKDLSLSCKSSFHIVLNLSQTFSKENKSKKIIFTRVVSTHLAFIR